MKDRALWLYFVYLLVIWGSFRYWVKLPDVVEELWFKPVIWLVPVFWWRLMMNGKPKMFKGDWKKAIIWGLVWGLIYFGMITVLRRANIGNISWSEIGIAIGTAIVEELTFSGFVLGYLNDRKKEDWKNLAIVAVMVMLIRLPISLWVYQIDRGVTAGVLLASGGMAIVNGWLRLKTDNTMTAILARMGMMIAVLG